MSQHVPILLKTITEALIQPDHESSWIVDCTLGGGGHTAEFLAQGANVIACDQDALAIEQGKRRFVKEIEEGRLILVHSFFSEIHKYTHGKKIVGLLADLGFSSDQMADEQRGMSFLKDGPLDMRMDQSQGESCSEFLSSVKEDELERIIREYGEERFSKRIASAIVSYRKLKQTPQTTKEFSQIVVMAIPSRFRHGRIHAATRTFQALRIHVNRELEELDALLHGLKTILSTGGRAAIISFHSLEDRKVKNVFRSSDFNALSKKPIVPNDEEILSNPRARSAKLRIAELK